MSDEFGIAERLKHLQGKHNQKLHGNRGAKISNAAMVTGGLEYSPNSEHVRTIEHNLLMHASDEAQAEIKRQIESELAQIARDHPVGVRVPYDAAVQILESGRIKTQFETGSSQGMYSTKLRARAEDNGLGIPRDVDPTKRPVYGYFMGAAEHDGTSGYGEIIFELKPSVKNRTTITQGDSLNGFADARQVGTPAKNPGIASVGIDDFGGAKILPGLRDRQYLLDRNVEYFEAQIYGGVKLNDIFMVRFGAECFVPQTMQLYDQYADLAESFYRAGMEVEITLPFNQGIFSMKEYISKIALKHLQGLHNQKRHGWRQGKPRSEESMRTVAKPAAAGGTPAAAPAPTQTAKPAAAAPKPAPKASAPTMTDNEARIYYGTLPLKDLKKFTDDFIASGGNMDTFTQFVQDWKAKHDAQKPEAKPAQKPVLTEASKAATDSSLDLNTYDKHFNSDGVFGKLTDPNGNMTAALRDISSKDDMMLYDRKVNELTKESGLQELFVKGAIEEWAQTSNNSDVSATIQMAASEIFKSTMSEWQERQAEAEVGLSPNPTIYAQSKKLINSMYKYTQETLKKQGIKEVKVYRGVLVQADSPAGKAIQAWAAGGKKGNPPIGGLSSNVIESWSLDPATAKYFAARSSGKSGYIAVTIGAIFSASRILSSSMTGFGVPGEGEFSVLKDGGNDSCAVLEVIL